MNREEILNTFLLANIPEIITQEEFDDVKKVIKQSQQENQELKKQLEEYKLITIDYQELEAINKVLKKQLEERPKEYVFIGNAQNKTRDFINQITKDNKEFKNQQKEFIEYMNKTIEELECDDVDDEEMKGYLIQRIDTFEEILSKYKSIIGGKDAIK